MTHALTAVRRLAPGVAITAAVAVAAWGLARAEEAWLHQAWLEGLVLAILLGTAVHTVAGLHPVFRPGIHFSAHTLLEVAIVLLGASISTAALGKAGPALLGAIVLFVVLALGSSYAIGRALGLPPKLATLVACGNSICGNSAIVATAPVIDAHADDVASSIAFTAALGVIVVVVLPFTQVYFALSERQFGVLAGMTVYAVPQVLAATAAAGGLSVQVGTLVKLVRVLMLGPVVLAVGLRSGGGVGKRPPLRKLVPWFIIGFLALMGLRSFELIPEPALAPMHDASVFLTLLAMAALGLMVNIRTVAQSGGRVLLAGTLSLVALAGISSGLIALLGVQ